MKVPIQISTTLLFCFLLSSASDLSCKRSTAILELSGDATVAGLFNIHKGVNCTTADAVGLQQMAAAAWIVNTLNQNNFLPGIKIGIALYDACSIDVNDLVETLSDTNCRKSYDLGLLTTPVLNKSLHAQAEVANISVSLTDSQSPKRLLIDTTVNTLVALNWTTVDYVLAPSDRILASFSKAASSNKLCIMKQRVYPEIETMHWKLLLQRSVLPHGNTSLIVVFGSWMDIIAVNSVLTELNTSSIQWVLVPFDTLTQRSLISNLQPNSLVVLPGIGILQEKRMQENMNLSQDHQEMYNATAPLEKRIFISYPLFMNVAIPILKIVTKFRAVLMEYCNTGGIEIVCPELATFHNLMLNYTIEEPRRDEIIKMILSSEYSVVTAVSHVHERKILNDFAIYEESPEEKHSRIKILGDVSNNQFEGEFCADPQDNSSLPRVCSQCTNYFNKYGIFESKFDQYESITQEIAWRPEAWVAAVTSIAIVGVICAIVIIIFIFVRLCKGDILEGNPVFSFLLLLSIIFSYLCTLPFSFVYNDENEHLSFLFCALRITGTSLSYALLFSIMLARSLMLASFDNEGSFMSHINGFLQSVLCIFILGVQIALSVQFLVIRTTFFNADKCTSMYEGYNFQILLCYDIFLLLLLVCTSPFSVRSKRNYAEGMFFTFASFISLLVWITWTTAYLILSREWKDVAISAGLTATATGILVSVFIPRTYLMMTAIVRDNLASALPSLACTNSTSILDLNYRTTSNQVLYDCVNPFPGGQLNPNFYSEQPQHVSIIKPDDTDGTDPDSTYEMYDAPASPNKVTHF